MEKTLKSPLQDKRGRIVRGVAIVSAAVLASSNALALTATDITAATTGSGADTSIDAGYLWALGIGVTLFVGRKILGMFGR